MLDHNGIEVASSSTPDLAISRRHFISGGHARIGAIAESLLGSTSKR
jgi:hypothetical protein